VIKSRIIMTLACMAVFVWCLGTAAASSDLTVSVHPETIEIGAGYNGAQVVIAGEMPADAEALIRIKGKPEAYRLKQKGKALGLLWMNLGSVEISHVPDLFLLFPSDPQDGAALRELGLGMAGVRQRARIQAEGEDAKGLFDEFVKLKHKSGLYGAVDNAIEFGPTRGGVKSFKATLPLPAALPQGTFDIEVYAIRDGQVAASVVRPIEAKEVGMPAWIAKLAFQHGTLYGVLAVIVAIFAGLLTGVLFKGEKGAH